MNQARRSSRLGGAELLRCMHRWCSCGDGVSCVLRYGGFHGHGDTPKWMVYFMENPIQKWVMTGGTPISGNLCILGANIGDDTPTKILQIIRESFCNAAEFHTTSDINTLGLAQLHPISHSRINNDICESVTSKKNNLFTSKPGSRKTNP